MKSSQSTIIFANLTVLALAIMFVLGTTPAEAQFANVRASCTPYGGANVTEQIESGTVPYLAEANTVYGANTAYAVAEPTRLRAHSVVTNGTQTYDQSIATARTTQHHQLYNAGLPNNGTGVFFFHYYLTGSVRVRDDAEDRASALISLGFFWPGDNYNGLLMFKQTGNSGSLVASTAAHGGGDWPAENIFAWPDGTTRTYVTDNTPSGGYFNVSFAIPVTVINPAFPFNQDPPVLDFTNIVEIMLGCHAMKDATCDLASTFEMAAQNPIVPDPSDPSLPATGWTMEMNDGEVELVTPLAVAATTGTGDVGFVTDVGTIMNLTAVDDATYPEEGRPEGPLPHGFFSLDIDALETGATATLGVSFPTNVPVDTHWWFYDEVHSWRWLPILDDDGDAYIEIELTDNAYGDADPLPGVIAFSGGPSDADAPQPTVLASFDAVPRAGGVDLAWRVSDLDPGEFRLVGRREARTWSVPYVADGTYCFVARDDNPTLTRGGRIVYDLYFEDLRLARRLVTLANSASPVTLMQVAPNPFNPETMIHFSVRGTERVEIGVYTLTGRKVSTLADRIFGVGDHAVEWNGRDQTGRELPSGTYLVQIRTDRHLESQKISLVR